MEVHVHIQFLSALFCVKQETKKNLLSDVGERWGGGQAGFPLKLASNPKVLIF